MEKKTITRNVRITKKKKLLVKQKYSKGNISITYKDKRKVKRQKW